MPVTLPLAPVSPVSLDLDGLTTGPSYEGLFPGFIPLAPGWPGDEETGGISTVSLLPLRQLPGVYPGAVVYPGPACYPGRGVTVLLTVRSVVAGNLVPALPTTALLAPAATVVKALAVQPMPGGVFPGPGVYPGASCYPSRSTIVRLVPEPVAA